MAEGRVKGLPRGIGHRLVEAGGLLDRRAVETDLKALSQAERRALRMLGVRIGAFSLYLPGLLTPEALAFARAIVGGLWRPPGDALSRLPVPSPDARALAARGLRAVGGLAAPVEQLERFDELLRTGFKHGVGAVLSDQALADLGWTAKEAGLVLRALGYVPTGKTEPVAWRRRNERPPAALAAPPVNSPFAALAGFKAVPPPRRRVRRRKPAAS
jgi:ATP-dependent RNA helicase SUPV3L1/SUV3